MKRSKIQIEDTLENVGRNFSVLFEEKMQKGLVREWARSHLYKEHMQFFERSLGHLKNEDATLLLKILEEEVTPIKPVELVTSDGQAKTKKR